MDKAILGKMHHIYVTYVANGDKGRWHVVTVVQSFKHCILAWYCKHTYTWNVLEKKKYSAL